MLINSYILKEMSRFWCDEDEEITSVTVFNLNEGKNIPLFCVGTYRYNAEEVEPAKGRILVFAVVVGESAPKQSGYQLSLVASAATKGCVYALVAVGGSIVAAVNSSVSGSAAYLVHLLSTCLSSWSYISLARPTKIHPPSLTDWIIARPGIITTW